MEAPPGFEPGMEVLQTSALPLGDGAGWNCVRGRTRPRLRCGYNSVREGRRGMSSAFCGPPSPFGLRRDNFRHGFTSGSWSGKRDSNPRLRPWQGRTLPLSYSRPRRTAIVPQRFRRSQWAASENTTLTHAITAAPRVSSTHRTSAAAARAGAAGRPHSSPG